MKDHKLYELTVNENGIRFRHANPNPMSAQQKFYITMTSIISAASCAMVLGFFWMMTGH